MMVKALIVEQLEADGTLRSLTMEPESHSGKIVVAFADEYQDGRRGPFHFQSHVEEKRFEAGFAKCNNRKLSIKKFQRNGDTFHVELDWAGIPTAANWLSYYALSLPKFAIPLKIALFDPRNQSHEYKRYVTRDDERQCYVVYLECVSRYGRFDFKLCCDFKVDELNFSHSSYVDAKTETNYGRTGDDWKKFLSDNEKNKVHKFFINHIHMGDTYSAGQAGAMGPQASAHDISFQQSITHQIGHINMQELASELETLRQEMRQTAKEPEQDISMGQIAAAQQAAKRGDAGSVVQHLKSAGKWALDVATRIGVSIATDAIKRSSGL